MTIIETAAIAWAVVATGGAGAVYGLMRRKVKKVRDWSVQLECMKDDARAKLDRGLKDAGRYIGKLAGDAATFKARAIDAEDRLRKIEQSRHLSAKHARAAQIAQQRAARDARQAA